VALIEIHGLTKLYRMGDSVVRALDGVDLAIERGEFVAITGASGSGKSTMMHLLGCLDRPTDGRYIFNDRDVSDLSDRQLANVRNQQIGFVFQTFNLINRTSALENVAVPLFYARKSNTRATARKALERVGLTQRATHRSNELSGGERQRVAIARAIVNDPLLLLADEPTGNLDSHTGEQIMEAFRALNQQGVTIVIVTHEYEVAIQARRIVQMRDGRIVSDRPTAELRAEGTVPGLQVRSADAAAAIEAFAGPQHPVAEAPALPAQASATLPDVAGQPKINIGRPRMARGATAAMVLGILAFGLAATTILGMIVAMRVFVGDIKPKTDFKPGDTIPKEYIRALIISVCSILGILVAWVLAIIGLVVGVRCLSWIRREPGHWRGRAQAHLGWILSALTIAGPVVWIAVGLIRAVLTKPGG
jgi:putative ABC transport system ATP-binding protein